MQPTLHIAPQYKVTMDILETGNAEKAQMLPPMIKKTLLKDFPDNFQKYPVQ